MRRRCGCGAAARGASRSRIRRRAPGRASRVELRERRAAERLRAARLGRERHAASAARVSSPDAVGAGRLGGLGHLVPQLERALEQRRRLAVGVDALGRLAARTPRPARPGGRPPAAKWCATAGGATGASALGARPRARARASGAALRARPGAGRRRRPRAGARGGSACRPSSSATRTWPVDGLAQRVAQRAGVEPAGLGEQRVVEPLATATTRGPPGRPRREPSTRSMSASRSVAGARRGRPRPRRAPPRRTAGCRRCGPRGDRGARARAARRGCPRAGSASSSRVQRAQDDPPGAGVALEVGLQATERWRRSSSSSGRRR